MLCLTDISCSRRYERHGSFAGQKAAITKKHVGDDKLLRPSPHRL